MIRSLTLHDVGPARDLEVKFGDRITVLTGDNGLGKTFLLDIAWWALTRNWVAEPARPREQLEWALESSAILTGVMHHDYRREWPSQPTIKFALQGASGETAPHVAQHDRASGEWSFPRGKPAKPGVVIYARIDGSFAIWDPAQNHGSNRTSDSAREPLSFTSKQLWDGTQGPDGKLTHEGLVRDLVTWQLGDRVEYRAIQAALAGLSTETEPLKLAPSFRVAPGDRADTPGLETRAGIIPLTLASAAVKRVIGLAYLIVWTLREHRLAAQLRGLVPDPRIVLLVDEPETHLHPRWQRLIVPALLKSVGVIFKSLSGSSTTEPSIQLVTATHSPLVLISLEPVFDDATDRLVDLEIVDSGNSSPSVAAHAVNFEKHGDVSHWLQSDSIGLASARSADAEAVVAKVEAAMATGVTGPDEGRRLDAELGGVLGELDPLWKRWRWFGSERGWWPA